ncbi:DUF1343 domain-containing protein [Candidatus Sumerlaeota bacterium]|nr:DUF1343 domain-containing protein [Candidatus Sumerlaeota bacterium]
MKRWHIGSLLLLVILVSCARVEVVPESPKKPVVLTGLDVLVRDDFSILKGKKVGLIANHSAVDFQGRSILDLMTSSQNVDIRAIFAPEHGFKGVADERVNNLTEEKTGLMIYSLYGESYRPTKEQMKDIDTFVFDIQDIGARFYTYISTMAMCMEEAAVNNIDFVVLDRPNPITGLRVAGLVQDKELLRRFTSYHYLPIVHGMTIGELARMFNEFYGIQCNLKVIKMEGWKRKMFFDETELPWVNPSPNIRSVTQEILYPGVALTEASESNVSVGRGTDTPFELFGAPWIDADKLAAELTARNPAGVQFTPCHFIPAESKFKGEECHGVRLTLNNRADFDPVDTGLHILCALYKLYPETYKLDPNYGLIGSRNVIERIKKGETVSQIHSSYQKSLEGFINIRKEFLLYLD